MTAAKHSPSAKPKSLRAKRATRKWSGEVTQHSHALSLESNVFKGHNPHRIATSLKRSADASHSRKGTPYQSAMSMLNFYINRAGHSLPSSQKNILQRAKVELRHVYGRG